MAKIKNSTPFDTIRKKFAKSDEIYFKNRKKDNATIGVRMKHPYDGGNSTNQQAVRAKFTTTRQAVTTALADTTQRATYEAAYKKQSKYLTLRGYVFAQIYHQRNGGNLGD